MTEHDETTKALIEAALAWRQGNLINGFFNLAIDAYLAAHPAPKLCKNPGCGRPKSEHLSVYAATEDGIHPLACPLTWSDPDE